MGIARALTILGAGASGWNQSMEDRRQRERQEEDDAFRREQRDRQRKQWERDDLTHAEQEAEKQRMRRDGATIEPTPVELPGPLMNPDNTPIVGGDVAGKQFGTLEEAKAYVAPQNTPTGRMRRQAAGATDPRMAMELATTADRAEAEQARVREAQTAAANKQFEVDLVRAMTPTGDLPGFVKFLNESKADGQGGAVKFDFEREGGKITLFPVGPDGTALSPGKTVDDNEMGRAELVMEFNRMTTPQQRLEHYRAQENTKYNRERQAERDKADADYRAATLAARTAPAGRASSGGGRSGGRGGDGGEEGGGPPMGGAPGASNVGMKDLLPILNRVGDIVDKEFRVGSEPAMGAPPDPAADAQRASDAERLKTTAQRLVMGAAQVGFPITAEIAVQVVRNGQVRRQQIRNPQTGEVALVQTMDVGGTMIPLAITPMEPELIGGGRGKVNPALVGEAQPAPAATPPAAAAPPPRMQQAAAPPPPALRPIPVPGESDNWWDAAPRAAPPAPTAPPNPAANRQGFERDAMARQQAIDRAQQALAPDVQALKALQSQLVAAGRSGDQRAIASYAAAVQQARAALAQKATSAMGQQAAQAFLQGL